MSEEVCPEAPARRKDDDDHRVFRFDGTVSLGHLITLLTLLSTILIWNIEKATANGLRLLWFPITSRR
jgi:hypothetical protein